MVKKSKLSADQKRVLLGVGILAMVIIIALVVVQIAKPKSATVSIPKEEIPKSAIPSEISKQQNATNAFLGLLNNSTYWSGDVGQSINGTIVAIDNTSKTIIFKGDLDGKLYYTRITDLTDTYIGNDLVSIEDFKVGMPITVEYEPLYIDTTGGVATQYMMG